MVQRMGKLVWLWYGADNGGVMHQVWLWYGAENGGGGGGCTKCDCGMVQRMGGNAPGYGAENGGVNAPGMVVVWCRECWGNAPGMVVIWCRECWGNAPGMIVIWCRESWGGDDALERIVMASSDILFPCPGRQQPAPASRPNYNVSGFSSPGPHKPTQGGASVIGSRDDRGVRKSFG